MSVGLARLKQHDAQRNSPTVLPEQQTEHIAEVLDSLLQAGETQNTLLAKLLERQDRLEAFLVTAGSEMTELVASTGSSLQSSITRQSDSSSIASELTETVNTEMREIGKTLQSLVAAIDGKRLEASVSSLKASVRQIETTTSWNSEQAAEFVGKYTRAMNFAGRGIQATQTAAVAAIQASGIEAAESVTTNLEAVTERAEKIVAVAERLQKPLLGGAAARLGLAFLPLAATLVMVVMIVFTVTQGGLWVAGMTWGFWIKVMVFIAGTGVLAGAGMGFWKIVQVVKRELDDPSCIVKAWSKK